MDDKPFSRNEIASRSRRRKQIKKEEAEKLGVVRKEIWISKEQTEAIEEQGLDLDECINKAVSLLLTKKEDSFDLPMGEIVENAFIKAKQLGL